MNSREEKIKLLSRMNREKASTPAMVGSLREVLGTPVDATTLISPSDADALMTDFRNGYAKAMASDALSYRRFFRQNELPLVQNLAEGLAQRLGGEAVYLLTKFNGDKRGVVLDASVLFSRVGPVIEFDGDSLYALSIDRSQGVLVDHNRDDREQAYELTAWGDRWPLLILVRDQGGGSAS
jgi:hypothetical protein